MNTQSKTEMIWEALPQMMREEIERAVLDAKANGNVPADGGMVELVPDGSQVDNGLLTIEVHCTGGWVVYVQFVNTRVHKEPEMPPLEAGWTLDKAAVAIFHAMQANGDVPLELEVARIEWDGGVKCILHLSDGSELPISIVTP